MSTLWRHYASWEDPDRGRSTRIGQALAGYEPSRIAGVLEALPPFWLTPNGGRYGLWLPGWDTRSVWGYDCLIGAYFAQLWGNDTDTDLRAPPDIWILGRGDGGGGRECVVSTTRWLACEIAAATGADLAAVVRAMLGIDPDSSG